MDKIGNYKTIINSFLKYLPSRFLIVFNQFIIIPVFALLLSAKEMSIFQISIGVLNLICTFSTDWIAKAVLRFYKKYSDEDNLDQFFSNVFSLSLLVYGIMVLIFVLAGTFIKHKFLLDESVLIFVLLLVIPCGIRQMLYQLLRILNKPFLYTFSIVVYQISLLVLFLGLAKIIPNVFAILTAMAVSMIAIDFYILMQIKRKHEIKPSLNFEFLYPILKYSLPLILTNISIWAIFNLNKFVFQSLGMIEFTAVVGICWLFVSSVFTPIFSTLNFAVFPSIIEKFEKNKSVKKFMTNTIQLYFAIFIPLVFAFCYFVDDIARMVFMGKYLEASVILPFFAITLFLHELMKLLNISFHLKNKTYLEMMTGVGVGALSLFLTGSLILKFNLLGAGIAILISTLLLVVINAIIGLRLFDFITIKNTLKTLALVIFATIASIVFVELIFSEVVSHFNAIKLSAFSICCYYLIWQFRNRILA